ncbi:hypothetical protein V6N13_018694 [Hibiscus sabdariffa]
MRNHQSKLGSEQEDSHWPKHRCLTGGLTLAEAHVPNRRTHPGRSTGWVNSNELTQLTGLTRSTGKTGRIRLGQTKSTGRIGHTGQWVGFGSELIELVLDWFSSCGSGRFG